MRRGTKIKREEVEGERREEEDESRRLKKQFPSANHLKQEVRSWG